MDKRKDIEYQELASNIRHWEQMRWVSMTVFMALMVASIGAMISNDIRLDGLTSQLVRVVGLSIVLIFWVQDERIVAYWVSMRARACEVEKDLGIEVFSRTPKRGLFSAGSAVRALYLILAVFWCIQVFR